MAHLSAHSLQRAWRLWKTQLPRYAASLGHVEDSEELLFSLKKYFNSDQKEQLSYLWQHCCEALQGEEEEHWQILFNNELGYPSFLKNIAHPPKVLFWQGRLLSEQAVAVIGCRKEDISLKQACFDIGSWLVRQKQWLLSGLARGCDTFAHQACLAYGGTSVAVLPSGFKKIYPAENRILATDILEQGGALCTEYFPNTEVRAWRCVQRNRIQSALSHTVILIASALQGGSMHTVKFSQQQRRELYVYPPELLAKKLDNSGSDHLLSHSLAKRWTPYQPLQHQTRNDRLFEKFIL